MGLIVTATVPSENGYGMFECLCDCGKVFVARRYNVLSGHTKSCGCGRSTALKGVGRPAVRTHGKSKTPEFRIWLGMKSRCFTPSSHGFKDYGGRGIRVCDKWKHDFVAFLSDVGPRPTPSHSLDRINNDGNYEPGNVRWADPHTQNTNTRRTDLITFRGRTMSLMDWSRDTGIAQGTLHGRIHRLKWSIEKALTTPGSAYHRRYSPSTTTS